MPMFRHGWRKSVVGLGFAGLIGLGVRAVVAVALPAAPPTSLKAVDVGASLTEDGATAPMPSRPGAPAEVRPRAV